VSGDFLQQLDAEFDKLLEFDEEPRTLLYHYTSASGFQGIAATRKLRCTDALHTNDYKEIRAADEVIRKSLQVRQVYLGGREPRATLYDTLIKIKRYADEHILKKSAIYLACFCKERTLLSQWRAYGDNGHGYCIGISHDGLETATYDNLSPTLASVLYGPKEVEQGFCGRLDKLCATLDHGWSSLPQSDQVTAINRAYNYVLMIAAKYAVRSKHIAFREENEQRLILAPIPGTDRPLFKADGRGSLVPYREIAFNGNVWLSEVWIGPAQDEEIGRKTVESFLRAKGYDPTMIKIRRYDAPYRAMR